MKKTFGYFFAAVLLVSCASDPATEEITDTPEEKDSTGVVENPQVPTDPKFNDFARYIAGQEGSESSYLKALESEAVWTSYRNSLETLWKKTNEKLPVIREWSAQELKDVNADGGTLFYPFAGADFLHADLFFPEYDNMCLVALEPIGNFPDLLKKKQDSTLSDYMEQLKKSMHAILGLSFFRTIAMADDFQSEMDGTLHVLMHFMARTDHEVLYQEKVAILPDGELTNDLSNIPDSSYIGNRFFFRKNGQEKIKTLTYFQINVQNTKYSSRGGFSGNGLDTRTDALAYFKKLGIKSTYLKSASYLLHRPSFSIIRNLILNESEHLIQDDSGIPLQFFDRNKWNLTFYGTYSFPISLFAERHQEDLKEAYRDVHNTVRPLPFGIGYQYRPGTSNMMRASKK